MNKIFNQNPFGELNENSSDYNLMSTILNMKSHTVTANKTNKNFIITLDTPTELKSINLQLKLEDLFNASDPDIIPLNYLCICAISTDHISDENSISDYTFNNTVFCFEKSNIINNNLFANISLIDGFNISFSRLLPENLFIHENYSMGNDESESIDPILGDLNIKVPYFPKMNPYSDYTVPLFKISPWWWTATPDAEDPINYYENKIPIKLKNNTNLIVLREIYSPFNTFDKHFDFSYNKNANFNILVNGYNKYDSQYTNLNIGLIRHNNWPILNTLSNYTNLLDTYLNPSELTITKQLQYYTICTIPNYHNNQELSYLKYIPKSINSKGSVLATNKIKIDFKFFDLNNVSPKVPPTSISFSPTTKLEYKNNLLFFKIIPNNFIVEIINNDPLIIKLYYSDKSFEILESSLNYLNSTNIDISIDSLLKEKSDLFKPYYFIDESDLNDIFNDTKLNLIKKFIVEKTQSTLTNIIPTIVDEKEFTTEETYDLFIPNAYQIKIETSSIESINEESQNFYIKNTDIKYSLIRFSEKTIT